MSIFESIQKAEKKAEQLRSEATEKVKLLLEEARIEAEQKAQGIYTRSLLEEKSIQEKTATAIGEKEKQISALYQQNDELLSKKANKNCEAAIAFIIGKVMEI